MRTPLVVVTGVDPTAMDSAMVGLAWGLPRAAAVRHRIDPETQALTRVVSDADGLLEQAQVDLTHACAGCAVREDVLPTLERLAGAGRWSTIVACLPSGAEADHLSTVLSRDPRLARRLRLSGVVAAVGERAVDELLGDTLLAERGWHTGPADDRGTGEVGCAQVELADTVLLTGAAGDEDDEGDGRDGADLVRALARPGTEVVLGADRLDPERLAAGRHDHTLAAAWRAPTADGCEETVVGAAWRVVLASPRPLHPERLVDRIASLGAGRHRSRGAFWVPTRPGLLQEWAGAGGQLSIGTRGGWGHRVPSTRLVLTGVGAPPAGLGDAFEALLVTPQEALLDPVGRAAHEDGLEPWLGDIHRAA